MDLVTFIFDHIPKKVVKFYNKLFCMFRMRNFLEHFQAVFDKISVVPQQKSKYWESKNFNFEMNLIWLPYMFSFQQMEESIVFIHNF